MSETLAEAQARRHATFLGRVERAEEILRSAEPDLSLASDGVTNFRVVQADPNKMKHLRPLLAYYAKKPHPFTQCVRDNRKRFGPRTEQICAVVKDLIRGTTHWRKGGNKKLSEQDGIPQIDDDVVDFLLGLTPETMKLVCDVLDGTNDSAPSSAP